MTVRVLIETENAAFEEGTDEVARILRVAADLVDDYGGVEAEDLLAGIPLRDVNGNTVGRLQTVR